MEDDSGGALQDPGEMQQGNSGTLKEKFAGAQLDLGQRQQDCALSCKAEVLQNDQAVHLDCGETGEGYYEAPAYSQEMLENHAVARGPPGMVVPPNNGCLLIQIQVVEIAGEDLLAQRNCVGPLWILPDMVQDESVDL